ncbi:MAG: pyrroline-5-carboxylate reductase [Betaproteobacteria bacterium HGW-Betaproteobacteria-8]|nr:MAG: pyrroline-5-carboxylate reductase [Betaproteobacteria bacterium HGW-Betaproteobacteria-8]
MQTEHQLNTLTISFIGGGNMARALIGGLLKQGFPAVQINVIESDAGKRSELSKDFGVTVTEQLPSVTNSDVVVLAVKPQQLRDVSIFLGSLLKQQLLISIAAGVRSADLSRWLGGYQSIVRVMPNTPAQIQLGVSALYATAAVSELQRQQAEALLQAVGQTLWLDDETQMDAVTAISGSGPAYVFYLIEAMQDAAITLGFSAEQAKMLSLQTFAGASQLAIQSEYSPEELRSQVTSKGGTTERAIQSLAAANIKHAIAEAAKAAALRSKELGDQLGSDQL